jgi:MFS transporter, MHS family, shikimate and dehydroshikimate transport protein
MKQNINKITFASAFGTLFEWYDFLIYGTAAALVFNKLFFPNIDPIVGMLAAMLTFAVGFIARPVGGILFGHFGDRYGRKNTLMATMLLMGVATFAIGLLPTYETIGIWAPIALVILRILQGIAFGGEWGGASLMILEHAPVNRRAFYGSFIQMGYPLGVLAATGMFAIMTRLPEKDFLDWGWRIPFLVSIVLVAIGGFVRSRLSETPVFEKIQKEQTISRSPLIDIIFKEPKSLLLGIGLKITEVTWAYLLTVFCVVYAVNNLGFTRSDMMDAVLIASAINLFAIPTFGYMSDVIGRRKIYIAGSLITLVIAYPIFAMLQAGGVIPAMIIGLVFGNALMMAPLATYLPELFKSNVRFTGASFSCQIAAALGGGVAPVLATWLATNHNGLASVSALMFVLGLITLISALLAKETNAKQLT